MIFFVVLLLLLGMEGLLFGKGRVEGVLGKSPLEKYWAQLETEIEGDKKSFGATFINLMETLSREKASMKVKNRAFSHFLESIPAHFFPKGFTRFDGGSTWALVFNQLGKILKRSLFTKEMDLLLEQCRSYVKSTNSTTTLLLSSLIDHLTTHRIDPCNFFVGAHPTRALFRHILPPSSPFLPPPFFSSTASSYLFGGNSDEDIFCGSNKPKIEGPPQIDFSEVNFEAVLSRWGQLFSISPKLCEREMAELMKIVSFEGSSDSAGKLVAIPVKEIPTPLREQFTPFKESQAGVKSEFIFARLKREDAKSSFVDVWVSPAEDTFITIPAASVIFFEWQNIEATGILPQSGPTGLMAACVGDPCAWIQSGVKFVIARIAKQSLEKDFSIATNFNEKFPTIYSLPSAFQNHQRLLSSFLIHNLPKVLSRKIIEEGDKYIEKYIIKLPSAYKESNKQAFLRQVKQIHQNLTKFLEQELKKIFEESETCLNGLRKNVANCGNGQRKNELCGWWLAEIEEQANNYLEKKGVDMNALPQDYMRCAPVNLEKVQKNLEVLTELLDSEELKDFVEDLTRRIYAELDEFIQELEFFVGRNWVEAIGCTETIPEESFPACQQDLKYLKEMKKMDDEIYEKRQKEKATGKGEKKGGGGGFEMTSVVPIAGLVMARFTMFECEHGTALELWGKRKSAHINPPPRSSDEFAQRLQKLGLYKHQGINWREADLQFYERLRGAPLPAPPPLVEVGIEGGGGGESRGFLEYFLGDEDGEQSTGNCEFNVTSLKG